MSATRSLRLLAGYARQGARERPDGLLSQQPVDHERRGGERGLPGSEIEKWRTLRLSEGGSQSYSVADCSFSFSIVDSEASHTVAHKRAYLVRPFGRSKTERHPGLTIGEPLELPVATRRLLLPLALAAPAPG